jgi:hypothetical protein
MSKSDIPCMVCLVPDTCKKVGQCLAFTSRQDPDELKKKPEAKS